MEMKGEIGQYLKSRNRENHLNNFPSVSFISTNLFFRTIYFLTLPFFILDKHLTIKPRKFVDAFEPR